jgi:hypothetical protein
MLKLGSCYKIGISSHTTRTKTYARACCDLNQASMYLLESQQKIRVDMDAFVDLDVTGIIHRLRDRGTMLRFLIRLERP